MLSGNQMPILTRQNSALYTVMVGQSALCPLQTEVELGSFFLPTILGSKPKTGTWPGPFTL